MISATPLDPDPYEANLVRVGESTVPGGGEGLFAARDIPSGTVLSFYNGVRFHDCHVSRKFRRNVGLIKIPNFYILGFQRLGAQLIQDPSEREAQADPGHTSCFKIFARIFGHSGAQGEKNIRKRFHIDFAYTVLSDFIRSILLVIFSFR